MHYFAQLVSFGMCVEKCVNVFKGEFEGRQVKHGKGGGGGGGIHGFWWCHVAVGSHHPCKIQLSKGDRGQRDIFPLLS